MSRRARIAEALARRQPLASRADLTAYRLVNGTGDGLPGLAIDRLDDVLVVHLDDAPPDSHVFPELADLPELTAYRAVYVKIHPRQASRQTLAPHGPARGEPVEELVVREHGLEYLVRPGAGLSTGLFLDMREVRWWVQHTAAGRQVLNLFAYTCGFGVCARRGGAQRVLNLDLSRTYLAWGQANYALNHLPVDPHDFVYGDALDWLARFARRQHTFDLVIVDPPSFSSTRHGTFAVERDYGRLAAAAARVVAPGGILLAATNHAGISGSRFDALLARGVAEAKRRPELLRRWHEPALDFPVAPGDAPYLKVRALALE